MFKKCGIPPLRYSWTLRWAIHGSPNTYKTMTIGPGAYFAHPFASEFNARSIGKNFSCRHLTTLGNKADGDNENRPIIGDNVTLGVNVTIIGGVRIGNNVTIGAGSVVIKDIPDNSIAVGNPCKPIRFIES